MAGRLGRDRQNMSASAGDTTTVLGGRSGSNDGASAADATATTPRSGDTAAMPVLHEAQQEVRREAAAARQQAAWDARNGRQPGGYGYGEAPRAAGPSRPNYGNDGYNPDGSYPPLDSTRGAQPYAREPYSPETYSQGQTGYGGGYAPPRQIEPVGHGRHVVARFFLALVSWVLRLGAIGLSLLVVLGSFTFGTSRPELIRAMAVATGLLPQGFAGLYVFDTPFGGAFRGDLAIAAIVLFVLDWILCRIRVALR